MKTTLYCPDMECESCEKVISKVLNKLKGIKSFKFEANSIKLDYDDKAIKKEVVINSIKDKGYRVYTDPYNRKPLLSRIKEFVSNKKKYELERKFFSYVSGTFVILLLAQALYQFLKRGVVFTQEFLWLTYLTITIVTIAGAIWHFKSYRAHVTSMTGMMIGMTLGMQTGMMIGMVLGVTNGFFWAGLIAMLFAAGVGAYNGYCCGITGVMEGLMAGGMGGLMGAMTSVMMGNMMVYFMPPFIILNLIIMIGFVYMVFEEVVEDKESVVKQPPKFWKFLLLTAVFLTIFTAVVNASPMGTVDTMWGANSEDGHDQSAHHSTGVPCHQMPDGTWMGDCEENDPGGHHY